jgi:hypothetical protein
LRGNLDAALQDLGLNGPPQIEALPHGTCGAQYMVYARKVYTGNIHIVPPATTLRGSLRAFHSQRLSGRLPASITALVVADRVFNPTKTDSKGLSLKFSASTHKSTGILSWLFGCASTQSPEQKNTAQRYGNRD